VLARLSVSTRGSARQETSSEMTGGCIVLMSERGQELGETLAYFRSCAVASTDPTLTYPAVPRPWRRR
jgi:hypothetical protein